MTDLAELDRLLEAAETAQPSFTGAVGKLAKCRRHQWITLRGLTPDNDVVTCRRCPAVRNEAAARRGKQSRNYGNRAELSAARKYGGEKIGAAGGPVDIRGVDFQTQVKTHRRLPPKEWTKAIGAMGAARERCPRLLLRFLPGPGLPPADYFVFRADDFLDWFGRDEDVAERDR